MQNKLQYIRTTKMSTLDSSKILQMSTHWSRLTTDLLVKTCHTRYEDKKRSTNTSNPKQKKTLKSQMGTYF